MSAVDHRLDTDLRHHRPATGRKRSGGDSSLVSLSAPASRGYLANPNPHGLRWQSRMRERRRLRLEPQLPKHTKALSPPASSCGTAHSRRQTIAYASIKLHPYRIKVKTMQKMPIFQVEPTETKREYLRAMLPMSKRLSTPDTIYCVLTASNHKPAKNARNQSRSNRIMPHKNCLITIPWPSTFSRLCPCRPSSQELCQNQKNQPKPASENLSPAFPLDHLSQSLQTTCSLFCICLKTNHLHLKMQTLN